MITHRTYGSAPYQIAVIHGGPGAAGDMEPVARHLEDNFDVIEPIQQALTVQGQVEELHELLLEQACSRVTLVGHSWGAWLSFILAAKHPEQVKKLILVGAGPFEEKYISQIEAARMTRLNLDERAEYHQLLELLNDPGHEPQPGALARLGSLVNRTDSYQLTPNLPFATPAEKLTDAPDRIYATIWPEAAALRRSGELLNLASKITCPVFALHGDHDPHPAAGVSEPLTKNLKNFRMLVLERCGHTPWLEKQASEKFYALLSHAIKA